MKTFIKYLPFFFPMLLQTACLPTMSTVLDTARTLERGEVAVQGSGSYFSGAMSSVGRQGDWGTRSLNLGGALQVGVADRLTLRGRYELYFLSDRIESVKGPILPAGSHINYLEGSIKWGILKNEGNIHSALALPIGLYLHPDATIFTVAPTAIATRQFNNKVDMTLQGKLHYLYGGGNSTFNFSAGLGLGLSNDLNRWAVRPEIAADFLNVTVGLGFTTVLNPK